MNPIIVAIDGYSSCGKSTLAKDLAKAIHYRYVDTGAMYRAVTLYFLRNNIPFLPDTIDLAKITDAIHHIHINFHVNPISKKSEVLLNDEIVEDAIRTMQVADNVSKVSAIKEVRTHLVALQQKMGHSKAVVLDGRDIGTVVFPQAELKLFLTARPQVRAQRRFDELQAKGIAVTLDEIYQNLTRRDHDDINRKESPLIQAEDAVVIDNSDITQTEQLALALELAKKTYK